jgi:hypothetical protein
MGARGVHPIDLLDGRQHRMIGVQEEASPVSKPLAHGPHRNVERANPPKERITREGLDERALDEMDGIARWMESP